MYRRNYFIDGQVTTPQITPEAVTEEKLADNAVTSPKIKDGTITGADIGTGQVQTDDIADGAVTQAKLGPDVSVIPLEDNAVTTPKIADNAVVVQKIANNAVTSDKIAAGAVTSTKIPDGSITGAKIATNTITQGDIANNAIGTGEIQNGAVTAEKLAPGVGGGERHVFLTPSVEGLYLASQSATIDWTAADLSPWIPAGARAAIVQLGMSSQAVSSGARAEMRIRADSVEREALCVSNAMTDKTNWNQGIIPLTTGRTVDYRLDVVGAITVTFWISIIGYVI